MSDSTSPRLFPFCKPGIMAPGGGGVCSEVWESVGLKSLERSHPAQGSMWPMLRGQGYPGD